MLGEILNSAGERLDYSFHEGQPGQKRIVVIGHGVTGNKDRPFLKALAEGLAAAGIPALRISFSGNGGSAGKFAASNVTKEISDLGAVLDALKDFSVCYAGHSMGGAVGVLRAARDPRIKWLISIAGMVHTKEFVEREFGGVKPGAGFMWDDETCPLSEEFMDDLTRIHSVLPEASRVKAPWLLIHGSEDDVVPVKESREIFARAN